MEQTKQIQWCPSQRQRLCCLVSSCQFHHHAIDKISRQGFVYLGEQTHQSQSQGEGYGIETRVCIHRTGANHKGRDAPDAPPLLLADACALASIPLGGDRWTVGKSFNNDMHIKASSTFLSLIEELFVTDSLIHSGFNGFSKHFFCPFSLV